MPLVAGPRLSAIGQLGSDVAGVAENVSASVDDGQHVAGLGRLHVAVAAGSRDLEAASSNQQVWDIIRALVAAGTTILLCTQYLEEADQLADGIAVIDHGKVIAEGTPGQLKASIGLGALHVRLLDPDQRPEAERVLARELDAVRLEPDPAALSAPCADADRAAEAVAELSRAGLRVADFSLGQPSLDEVFLALTGHPADDERGEDTVIQEEAA